MRPGRCVQCDAALTPAAPSEFWCCPGCVEGWQAAQAGIDIPAALRPTGYLEHARHQVGAFGWLGSVA